LFAGIPIKRLGLVPKIAVFCLHTNRQRSVVPHSPGPMSRSIENVSFLPKILNRTKTGKFSTTPTQIRTTHDRHCKHIPLADHTKIRASHRLKREASCISIKLQRVVSSYARPTRRGIETRRTPKPIIGRIQTPDNPSEQPSKTIQDQGEHRHQDPIQHSKAQANKTEVYAEVAGMWPTTQQTITHYRSTYHMVIQDHSFPHAETMPHLLIA
jgi:hypothetical protein